MTDRGGRVRVAALADIHVKEGMVGEYRELFAQIGASADIFVLCGDLTTRGLPKQVEALVEELSHLKMPVLAVLGNHDYECGHESEVEELLCQAGVTMLGDEPYEFMNVGFAGVKGFCGGFDQHVLTPFGEPCIKTFVHEAMEDALRLEAGLAKLRTQKKVAVLHYSPIRATVEGEAPEIFPFLGSSRLAEPIDRYEVVAALHGHAHHGTHTGRTAKGVPVYNVAYPLMQKVCPERPYLLLEVEAEGE